NVKQYKYFPLVLSTCAVTQHMSIIFIFVGTFIQLSRDQVDPTLLVWSCISAFPIGNLLWEVMEWRDLAAVTRKERRLKATKSSILVLLILVTITPVLKTLTEATSSDSIWALSAILFCLNAILADYSAASPYAGKERLTSVLSMNAAIAASVVLASRLTSNLHVFALVLYAVQLFALFPLLRQRIQYRASAVFRTILTILLGCLAAGIYIGLHIPIAVVIASILVFVTFACPALFMWAQKFKNELKGPWDPAIPIVRQQEL
ncbi:hypothetical protein FRB90_004180, partial [Tulasnella sp. 427]